MKQQHFSGRLIFLTLSGFLLLALGLSSVPAASAERIPPSPAVEITEALTNTPAPTATATIISIYFLNPTLPSCVGAGCASPGGYNNIMSATLTEQSLYAYDPSSKYWTGGGRVETKIRVNGAGIGTVRLYYAYNGVNCASGYAVYVFKLSGNVNYPNLPLSGYFDVTVTSSDQGSFSFYTRCSSSGSYVGDYGIDSLWYSLVQPATPTPTATATLTSTPTSTPTSSPTSTITPTPNRSGSGTCWSSGASWPNYYANYTIDSNTIPADWVTSIDGAANTWTNVTPSHFIFYNVAGTDNVISKGHLADPDHIALASVYASATTPITKVTLVFSDTKPFDTGSPPAQGSYSVENIATHEFGHWLMLKDIYDQNCSDVTMFGYAALGETKKISLETSDENAINWQYP